MICHTIKLISKTDAPLSFCWKTVWNTLFKTLLCRDCCMWYCIRKNTFLLLLKHTNYVCWICQLCSLSVILAVSRSHWRISIKPKKMLLKFSGGQFPAVTELEPDQVPVAAQGGQWQDVHGWSWAGPSTLTLAKYDAETTTWENRYDCGGILHCWLSPAWNLSNRFSS